MRRILGLDYGERRIGVAVSDEEGQIAFPRNILTVHSTEDAIRKIAQVMREIVPTPTSIVIGLPRHLNGTDGRMAHHVQAFAKLLETSIGCLVVLWDERLSSQEAERLLLSADTSRNHRHRVVDKLAAQLILQSYLDSHPKVAHGS